MTTLILTSSGLETDSGAYEVLGRAVKSAPPTGLFLEIGTRRGGSTKVIIDEISKRFQDGLKNNVLICLDPWGNIEYAEREGTIRRLDYTNSMRADCMRALYNYVHQKPVSLHVLTLEDTEYFARFHDGYPVYNENKSVEAKYAHVFFDGPHDVASLKKEIDFFHPRSVKGSTWVFDDVVGYYPHDEQIEPYLLELGWKLVEKQAPKASYILI